MDSLRREFDAAWARFQSLDRLRLVPDTLESEWTRGRDTYLAFLIGIDDPAVVEYLKTLVTVIEGIPGVESYPEEYWHITIKGIGFGAKGTPADEDVGEHELERISDGAGMVFAQQAAFVVQVGPANAFPEVVFAEVGEGLPVREMNVRLLEAAPDLVRYPFDGEAFLPHVSIARFKSDEGLADLKSTLAAMRHNEPGPSLAVSEVRLVRAHLSAAAPRLETIEAYRLG
jgi:2'-5' RNA ligase